MLSIQNLRVVGVSPVSSLRALSVCSAMTQKGRHFVSYTTTLSSEITIDIIESLAAFHF
jgi:hypothetical protein